MMRVVGVVIAAELVGCSFFMNKQPATWDTEQEPTCSESYAAPTFDAVMSFGFAFLAALAANEYHSHGNSCGAVDINYGYPVEPSCMHYNIDIGGGLAAAALFGYSAYVGHAWAGRCTKANNEHDHWLAQQRKPLPGENAEMRNQCLAERAKIEAEITDPAEKARLSETLQCEQPPPKRAKPRHTEDRVGVGLFLGAVVSFTLDAIAATAK